MYLTIFKLVDWLYYVFIFLSVYPSTGENEPLIPTRTVFILTTNSNLVRAGSSSNIRLNEIANERYFDRPEVIKACKEQQHIQIPDFKEIEDNRLVVNRFRSRSGEGVSSYYLITGFKCLNRYLGTSRLARCSFWKTASEAWASWKTPTIAGKREATTRTL